MRLFPVIAIFSIERCRNIKAKYKVFFIRAKLCAAGGRLYYLTPRAPSHDFFPRTYILWNNKRNKRLFSRDSVSTWDCFL